MESVIATVSGYCGLERMNLIRLIDSTGGSYVGSLNKSTTHLICWRFEGRKYELARKLKATIVNHRWLEDSVKQGRILPEHPYTLICGEKVGPLKLDVAALADKQTASNSYRSTSWNDTTEPVINITGEKTCDAGRVRSSVLKENMLPEPERNKDSSSRPKRKLIKACLKQDKSSRTGDFVSSSILPRRNICETEELTSPSPPQRTRLKTSNNSSARTSRSAHSLIKYGRVTDADLLEPFFASDEENDPPLPQPTILKTRNNSSAGTSHSACRLLKKARVTDSDPLEPFYASDEENDPSPPQRTRSKTSNNSSVGTTRSARRLVKRDRVTDSDPLEPFYATDEENDSSPPPRTRLKTRNDSSPRTSRRVHRQGRNDTVTDSDPLEPFYATDEENDPTGICQDELSSPLPPPRTRLNTRNNSSAGTSRSSRKQVNRVTDIDPLEPFYASSDENDPPQPHHRHHNTIAPPNSLLGGKKKGRLRLTHAPKEILNSSSKEKEDIQDINDHRVVIDDDDDDKFNDKEPVSLLPTSEELSCVICHTDFSSTRGVLPCGHRFCFSCIKNWADHVVSRGKISTCPLCKASFSRITIMDEAVSTDQKIYSQTIPNNSSSINIYNLPERQTPTYTAAASTSMPPVCLQCCRLEPEDLLIRCQICEFRRIHTYCMDPPTNPWTCIHCRSVNFALNHR
jgi:hypothetical protein